MLVSIIIPTYNRIDKLKRVLAGLEEQTLAADQWEVIVIDDGSKDNTICFLQDMDFPFNFRILTQDHLGPWPARNLGVCESKGEILLFMDDDIYPREQLIEEHVKMLSVKEPKLAGIRGHLLNWPEREVTPFLRYFDRYTAPEFFARRHGKKIAFNFIACANQSIRKDLFVEMGGFHPDFAGFG